jgi:hypothetical protein
MNPPEPRGALLSPGVVAAVVVGALWRVGVLSVDKWHQPLLLNDSIYYSGQAKQLARGVWFRELFVDQPGAEHGPLTSVLMAPLSWMDHPEPWQRIVTVLCGVATIVVLAAVARRVASGVARDGVAPDGVAGARAGVVAAWIAALYPNLWMNDGLIMSESVSTLCVGSVLLTALRWREAPSVRRLVPLGVLLGLAALARSELVLAIPLVALWCWFELRRDWRTPVLVMATAAAVLAPWAVFNMVRFERPVLLTTTGPIWATGRCCAWPIRPECWPMSTRRCVRPSCGRGRSPMPANTPNACRRWWPRVWVARSICTASTAWSTRTRARSVTAGRRGPGSWPGGCSPRWRWWACGAPSAALGDCCSCRC